MYTGEVHVAGPAGVHELPRLIVSKLAVGPMNNNTYLLRDRDTGQQLLIDAAAEPDRIMALIGSDGIQGILTTHRHQDHWGALEAVRDQTGAPTMAGEFDVEGITVPTDIVLSDGDTIALGTSVLSIIHLRGHTPGSVAVLYEDPFGHPHLFTGDSLFPGGVGKTWSDADFVQLLDDVETRIFGELPDDTWVYPGHGFDTNLGRERPQLGEWRSRGW
jgi:glyoxylase-like metal-dependent hydrolase (beta-lactamase superfamily II)